MDYGEKRIGIAISDPLGVVAQPLETIQTNSQAELIKILKNLITDNQINLLLIGNPLDHKGEPTPMSRKISGFIDAFKKECTVEIKLWDERFTSRLAERSLREHGIKARKKGVDSIAASIILSEFLSTQRV